MTIKEAINNIIERNEEMSRFLEDEGNDYSLDVVDIAASKYVELLQKWNFNLGLGSYFANILLVLNDEKLITQFDLQDVRKLYESLLDFQECNLDNYVDLAHFEHAIMDNSEHAKQITLNGIMMAKRKIEELESLLKHIEREK
ncbi:hypothetical protein C8N40_10595 [Pontibacter mucosus]|uniref:Uncharacterized protein n=1 Tax=Pontibacter mucosus TaxID=1649266 RepID=A0A2T5YHM6_9BACT|nr:hypothetical protein [Pontibacter mucosus]PTX18806.1 hypothetical protein C8N40_10595 [Pontibacter mucosus]